MARYRRQSDSSEFGSDSFLDIVANIVGILIILIVIAGVRMSQAPLSPANPASLSDETTSPEAPGSLPPTEEIPSKTSPIELPVVQLGSPEEPADESGPDIRFDISLGAAEPWPIEPDPETLKQISQREETATRNRDRLAMLVEQQTALIAQINSLSDELTRQEQALSQQSKVVKSEEHRRQVLQNQLADKMKQLADLDQQLVLRQREVQPQETLEHTIVPVSQIVNGHEWHFEVRGGRVSFIPLDELIDQLKVQVKRRSDWLARFHTHEGIIGPIKNFAMEYKVSRKSLSLAEELSYGRGIFRIGIDRWELVPIGEQYGESATEARQPHSQFRQAINRASFEDAITLWVYPDSFDLYRELVKIAHEQGHQVAARPLPMNRRIAGSPHGSKSISQ